MFSPYRRGASATFLTLIFFANSGSTGLTAEKADHVIPDYTSYVEVEFLRVNSGTVKAKKLPDNTPQKAMYPVVDVHAHLRNVTAEQRLEVMDAVGVAIRPGIAADTVEAPAVSGSKAAPPEATVSGDREAPTGIDNPLFLQIFGLSRAAVGMGERTEALAAQRTEFHPAISGGRSTRPVYFTRLELGD